MPDPKTAIVPRMDAQVKIDGVLDEQPWQKAARLTPFVRNDSTTPARVETEVRLWYDQAALYLGWICEDYDIQATFTQHDSRFWEEEVVEFFVTTGPLDRYFELQWNPLGGTFDAIIANDLGPDGSSRQFKGDWSYTAESMTPRREGGRVGAGLERSRHALDRRSAHSVRRSEGPPARARRRVAGQLLSIQPRPRRRAGTTQLVAHDFSGVSSAGAIRLSAVLTMTELRTVCAAAVLVAGVACGGRQPPGLVRLYVLDGGTLHVTDPSRFQLKKDEVAELNFSGRMLSGHPSQRSVALGYLRRS